VNTKQYTHSRKDINMSVVIPGAGESIDQAKARLTPNVPFVDSREPNSTVDKMKAAGSKPAEMGATNQGSEITSILAQGRQIFSEMGDVRPVVSPVASKPGDATNISKGAGITDGKPAAGMGRGDGRQPAKPGTTVGGHLAPPRSAFNPAQMGANPANVVRGPSPRRK
jgi:hypothetical protein